MDWKTILFECHDAVAIITMNRPDELNALNADLCEELVKAIEICREDEGIRAVVLTGAGKAFCSGGDLKDAKKALGTPAQSHFFRDVTKTLHRLIMDLRLLPKPVIASINGSLGGAGFSLALACDLRIATDNAKLKQAYTSIGLSPDGGFTLLASAVIGLGKISELVFLDPVLNSQQALEIGLLHKVVPSNELLPATLTWANKLAKGATHSYATVKNLLNVAFLPALEKQLELERQGIMASSNTFDYQEGITAFFEKRYPDFKGK